MKRDKQSDRIGTPPGMSLTREKVVFYVLLAAGILQGLTFFSQYQEALEELYRMQRGSWSLLEFLRMDDFYVMVRGKYLLLGLAMVWCVSNVVFRYLHYYQGSKSIYLMRRLPARGELYRSCLAKPMQRLLLCVVVWLALLLISYAYYMEQTPARWLAPDQWQKLWRAIL